MNFVKIFILFICFYSQIFAQQVTLYRVNVEGNTTTSDKMIKYSAGLRDGSKIQRSDISTAITRLWDLGLFEDINIVLKNESQLGVEITIKVIENPVLNNIRFTGTSIRKNRLNDKISIKQGQRIKANTLDESAKEIRKLFLEDGYFNVKVSPSMITFVPSIS